MWNPKWDRKNTIAVTATLVTPGPVTSGRMNGCVVVTIAKAIVTTPCLMYNVNRCTSARMRITLRWLLCPMSCTATRKRRCVQFIEGVCYVDRKATLYACWTLRTITLERHDRVPRGEASRPLVQGPACSGDQSRHTAAT